MKKILLSFIASAIMSTFAVHADTGKKPASKKAAKTENCKKTKCNKTSCTKATCPTMPGCVCH